jgi:hypothetical protein
VKLLIPRQDNALPLLRQAEWRAIAKCLINLAGETAETRSSFLNMVYKSCLPSATISDLQNVVAIAYLFTIASGNPSIITRDPRYSDILFRVQQPDSESVFIIPGGKLEVCVVYILVCV